MIMTASYCEGLSENKVAFVFLCPGQVEEILQKPVASTTGAHLECVISELRKIKKLKDILKSNCRYDYRIVNLSEEIHYEGGSNGEHPSHKKIKNKDNIERLIGQLNDMEYIVVFAKKYKDIVKNSIANKLNCSPIIYTSHLSARAVNQISKDTKGLKIEKGSLNNLRKRIAVIASEIKKQFGLRRTKNSKNNIVGNSN